MVHDTMVNDIYNSLTFTCALEVADNWSCEGSDLVDAMLHWLKVLLS